MGVGSYGHSTLLFINQLFCNQVYQVLLKDWNFSSLNTFPLYFTEWSFISKSLVITFGPQNFVFQIFLKSF